MIQPHDLIEIPGDLLAEIQFELPECPDSAIQQFVQNAIRDFCEQSHYWHESAEDILVLADESDYELALADGLELVSVIRIDADDNELVRSNDACVRYRFWQDRPGVVTICPADELIGQSLKVVVAVRPVIAEPFQVSQSLINDFRVAIKAGALAALYKVPRKEWADPQQAAVNQSIYDSLIVDARLYQGRGFTRMPDRAVRKNREFY